MPLVVLPLLLMRRVAGQLQCPQVAASFGDDLDLSSFLVLLDQPEGVGHSGNERDGGQRKLQDLLSKSISIHIAIALHNKHYSLVTVTDRVNTYRGPERIGVV